MFIEITPTTQLPVFEAYLDGNGGTETADGNDNGINTATQHTYLDGNFSPVFGTAETVEQYWQYNTQDISIATELSYNFKRTTSALCARFLDGTQQAISAIFDGNANLVTNTMYHHYEGIGSTSLVDGNSPRSEVTDLTIIGLDINTIATGDSISGAFVFRFPEFIRLQANGDTTDNHLSFGPRTLQNEFKSLASNIAYVDAEFDYTIKTLGTLKKIGVVYPNTEKAYTDTTYSLAEATSLLVAKGEAVDRVSTDLYRDKYGVTTAVTPRLLIVASGYSDGKMTVYNAAGNAIGSTADFITIACDPEYTGTKYYLYSKATLANTLEADNTSTLVVPDHEEYQLKGVVLYQDAPYWMVLQYISRNFYSINTMTLVTEDLTKIRNKDIFVTIEFNKELTN